MGKRKSKPKRIPFELIPPFEDGRQVKSEPFRILDDLLPKFHFHLVEARIALAWRLAWKPDRDGRLTLGQCRKASDLDRELRDYDFVILLNKEAWQRLKTEQRRALVDHELCHAQVQLGDDGEPKKDERGRIVYRVRGHDLEEFRDIVGRHGCYKDDIRAFVEQALRQEQPGLFERPALPVPAVDGAGNADNEAPVVCGRCGGYNATDPEKTGLCGLCRPRPRAAEPCVQCGAQAPRAVTSTDELDGTSATAVHLSATLRSVRRVINAGKKARPGYVCGACHAAALKKLCEED